MCFYKVGDTILTTKSILSIQLKPYACVTAPLIKHKYQGYKRAAVDGMLYLKKIQEYIEYGENESPDSMRDPETGIERG